MQSASLPSNFSEDFWRKKPTQMPAPGSRIKVDSANRCLLEYERMVRTNKASGDQPDCRLGSDDADSGITRLPQFLQNSVHVS
jgi:hypothetical protein